MSLRSMLPTTMFIRLLHVVLIPETCTILPNLRINEGGIFTQRFYVHEHMLISIHFKRISACSKVFVECKTCFGEFEEASSSSSSLELAPLDRAAYPNTKKLKRACIKSLRHFATLGSRNPQFFDATNFIA